MALGVPDEGQTRATPLDLERETQEILDAVAGAARLDNALDRAPLQPSRSTYWPVRCRN